MKAKTPLFLVLILFLLSAAGKRTYMGQRVFDMSFAIAGGKTVSLPVTDAGPIPAENRTVKIESAGIAIRPAVLGSSSTSFDPPHGEALLSWGFMFTLKTSKTLERVAVEEVFPSDVARVLVNDQSPSLRGKVWSGGTVGVAPDPASALWLFTDEPSVFVFRFTIEVAGKTPVVLYQPAWFSQASKEMFRRTIVRINGG
jgi:hypothetical protein